MKISERRDIARGPLIDSKRLEPILSNDWEFIATIHEEDRHTVFLNSKSKNISVRVYDQEFFE